MQHIAFQTDDIFRMQGRSKREGLSLLPVPGSYYGDLKKEGYDPALVRRLEENGVMIDTAGGGRFLHADTQPMAGGLGNDTMYGQDGAETYVFSRGDGIDALDDNGWDDTDVLAIHDYSPDEVTLGNMVLGSDGLVLSFAGTADQITIWNTLGNNRNDKVEQFKFDDGTLWTPADINARLISGTGGGDALTGGVFGDHIEGGAGNDTLDGQGGPDLLKGGTGDDLLWGGLGDDTLVFKTGAGNDTVQVFSAGPGSDDVLDVGVLGYLDLASVLADTVQNGTDAVITPLPLGGDSITLVGVDKATLYQDDFIFV